MAVEFVTGMFNETLANERMPKEWGRSVLVLHFKSYENYRGVKLVSHTMTFKVRVGEASLSICE